MGCIDRTRIHPFTIPVFSVPLMTDTRIEEFLSERALCSIERSAWRPIVRAGVERHIHIDLAVTGECVGITMAHPYMMEDARLGVYVDFMLRIKPPAQGGEIELGAVVNFVRVLRDTYHFKIKKVTFDQAFSRMPIQLLLQQGFAAEHLSVDLVHFTHLKTCFNERRISMYEYAPMLEEVDNLIKDPAGGRPHHRPKFLDDVLDSLAGCVSRCYNVESSRKKTGKKTDRVDTGTGRGPLVIVVGHDHQQEEFRS